jgi:uncharacterized membrane protein
MKFAVGLLLTTFGTFWAGEGVGIDWPLEDAAILVLLAIYVVASLAGIWFIRARMDARRGPARGAVS